jgi:outer membrane protein assembly factor BamA
MLVFATSIALCSSPVVKAQTELPSPSRCAPGFRQTDEFKEMAGLKEYPKIHIDSAKIEGSTHVAPASQRKLITSLGNRQFVRNSDWPGAAEAPVEELWRDEGFFKVQVTSEEKVLNSVPTLQHVSLVFHVQEGDRYRLRDVRFRALDAGTHPGFSAEQLRKLVPMEDGGLFDVREVRTGLENLKVKFSNAGYIDFIAVPQTIIDNASHTISLHMELQPGPQYRVGSLQFLGTYQKAQDALKSQMKANDIFSPTAISNFFLQNKRILPPAISLADVQVTRNQEDSTVNLVFDFRDCPR